MTSATPLTARVSASRMMVASVVKRAASCGRGLAFQPREVGVREMGEHAALQFADHQQHDLLHLDVLEVLRRPP